MRVGYGRLGLVGRAQLLVHAMVWQHVSPLDNGAALAFGRHESLCQNSMSGASSGPIGYGAPFDFASESMLHTTGASVRTYPSVPLHGGRFSGRMMSERKGRSIAEVPLPQTAFVTHSSTVVACVQGILLRELAEGAMLSSTSLECAQRVSLSALTCEYIVWRSLT